jgi:hypothetical protein
MREAASRKVLMSDQNPYHCPVCDASFASIEDVQRHKTRQHLADTRSESTKINAAAPRKNKVFTRSHSE